MNYELQIHSNDIKNDIKNNLIQMFGYKVCKEWNIIDDIGKQMCLDLKNLHKKEKSAKIIQKFWRNRN